MIDLQRQRGLRISHDVEVRNRTNADIEVQQQYAMIRLNLAKCKPPIIITISPGRKDNGSGEA